MKNGVLRMWAVGLFFMLLAVMPVGAKQPVKNVVLMIGDGMGLAHVTSLMIDRKYQPIQMERAQAVGLVKTYSANNRVTDSAASATAYATGKKTDNSKLGVDPEGNPMETILEKAVEEGMATGVVVTTFLPHATPAAFFAHVNKRYDYPDIAAQFVESGITVAMGGGRDHFTKRDGDRDLLQELEQKGYLVVDSVEKLDDVTSGRTVAIYPTKKGGLPGPPERGDYLPDATAKMLEILGNSSKKGFFAMIEGSDIDHASHANEIEEVIAEMRDFDRAVGVAFDYADEHPGTLVIVLADHETGGLALASNKEDFTQSESGIKYCFSTGGHSGVMIPLFAYGAGADTFGRVLDNTEVNRLMCEILGLE